MLFQQPTQYIQWGRSSAGAHCYNS